MRNTADTYKKISTEQSEEFWKIRLLKEATYICNSMLLGNTVLNYKKNVLCLSVQSFSLS